jgi:uncharacterized protein
VPRFIPLRVLFVTVSLVAGALCLPAQARLEIPAPRGHVNDFASVLTADEAEQIEGIARYVRARGGGEIAIVTLPDLGGRDPAQVALQIGREWKVGGLAEIGERSRNAGVVILLVPKETSSDGRGYIRIEVGNGAEGFIPDAVAGRIRDEGTQYFPARYGAGLTVITARVAQRYAAEFGFTLDSLGMQMAPTASRSRGTAPLDGRMLQFIAFVVIAIVVLTARGGRGGCASFLLGQAIGNAMGRHGRYRGGRYGGFGGGGWSGGGGGGFGGFGGGGGFSGGGAGGSF